MVTTSISVLMSGVTDTINLPFEYVDQGDIQVFVEGVQVAQTAYTFPTAEQVKLAVGAAALVGKVVQVRRVTAEDNPLVVFSGSGEGLSSIDLNLIVIQLLYLIQELREDLQALSATGTPGLFSYPNGVYMAQVAQGLADPNCVGYDPTFKVMANIPPEVPYSAVAVGFKGRGVRLRDSVYMFIQSQLGMTATQMDLFMQQCSQYPPTPETDLPVPKGYAPGTYPLMVQVLQGLATADPSSLVLSNIPPLVPYSAVAACYRFGLVVRPGDAFANFIQTQLGMTAQQTGEFLASCINLPVSP